jgi:hypothetical protein
VSYDPEGEIERYLGRLSRATHDVPKGRRRELLSEIELHIRQALAQTPCTSRAEMAALLEQVGDPAEIAAAANDQAGAGFERSPGTHAFLSARRPRNVIMTLVALALVGLALGAGGWIQTYQPLAFARADALPVDSVNTVGENDHGAWVGYHDGIGGGPGRPFFGVTIQNTGSFTVRVVGLGRYLPALPMFDGWSSRLLMARYTAVRIHDPERFGNGYGRGWKRGPLQPFHPVDLGPGQILMVVRQGVWRDCQIRVSEGTTTPPGSFPIRYSFLWKTTTAHIPLPGGLTIAPAHNPRAGCRQAGSKPLP